MGFLHKGQFYESKSEAMLEDVRGSLLRCGTMWAAFGPDDPRLVGAGRDLEKAITRYEDALRAEEER